MRYVKHNDGDEMLQSEQVSDVERWEGAVWLEDAGCWILCNRVAHVDVLPVPTRYCLERDRPYQPMHSLAPSPSHIALPTPYRQFFALRQWHSDINLRRRKSTWDLLYDGRGTAGGIWSLRPGGAILSSFGRDTRGNQTEISGRWDTPIFCQQRDD